MNKTILMLLNGFGIERKDSTSIYSASLTPNLNTLMNEVIFGTLESPYADYDSGYEAFCIPKKIQKEDEIDKMIDDEVLNKNEFLNEIKGKLNANNKLHVFYILSDYTKVVQIRYMLKMINENKDKNIVIDVVLDSSNVNDYDKIDKTISKINIELNGCARIGFVVGKNKLGNDNTLRMIYKELGEHWREYSKKIDVLRRDLTIPEDAEPFAVGDNLSIKDGDVIWFLNYQDINLDRFRNNLKTMNLTYYTLYNMIDGVKSMLTRVVDVKDSISGILDANNINLMIFTDNDHINDLNYYMNGMRKETTDKITYAINDSTLFGTSDDVIGLINSTNKDGYILDYDLGHFITIKQLKEKLAEIDKVIGSIYEASQKEGYTFIVSSVYGMHMMLKEGVVDKLINFSGKVPCLYYNKDFPKKSYRVNGGGMHDLALTYLTSIYDDLRENRLIAKGGGLKF